MRSSLADAAFAVEERLVWGGADVMRRVFEVVKWPFERAAWAVERGLIWPVEERTGEWNGSLRAAGVAALALLAVGAGVLGLIWASGSGGGRGATQASAPAALPVVRQAASDQPAPAAPHLQGAKPDFTAQPKSGVSSGDALAGSGGGAAAAGGSAAAKTASTAGGGNGASSASASVVPAGPPATAVAHRFANGFVLFETGQNSAKFRTAFASTATPQLAHSLLRRPPRLPAGVKVPQAKVVNVVGGPHHGDTYTLSVSLLRVGVTSELRLEMQRDAKSGEWRVVRVLG